MYVGGEDLGSLHFYADILEYSDLEGKEKKWSKVGEMLLARADAGASVVSFDEYKDHCQ